VVLLFDFFSGSVMSDSSSATMNDSELFENVRKYSADRLRSELKNYQQFFNPDEIDKMEKKDLNINVTKLRKIAGVTGSVKTLVSAFNPNMVSLDFKGSSTPATPSTPS